MVSEPEPSGLNIFGERFGEGVSSFKYVAWTEAKT